MESALNQYSRVKCARKRENTFLIFQWFASTNIFDDELVRNEVRDYIDMGLVNTVNAELLGKRALTAVKGATFGKSMKWVGSTRHLRALYLAIAIIQDTEDSMLTRLQPSRELTDKVMNIMDDFVTLTKARRGLMKKRFPQRIGEEEVKDSEKETPKVLQGKKPIKKPASLIYDEDEETPKLPQKNKPVALIYDEKKETRKVVQNLVQKKNPVKHFSDEEEGIPNEVDEKIPKVVDEVKEDDDNLKTSVGVDGEE